MEKYSKTFRPKNTFFIYYVKNVLNKMEKICYVSMKKVLLQKSNVEKSLDLLCLKKSFFLNVKIC